MGLTYNTYLDGKHIYGCKNCKAHLANHDDIISRVSPSPLLPPSHHLTVSRSLSFMLPPLLHLLSPQNFRGQHGKAYLFNAVVNIDTGEQSDRNMTTGRHLVRDISCRGCKETVGWKYDRAFENPEKYKEGKFILEAELLCQVG